MGAGEPEREKKKKRKQDGKKKTREKNAEAISAIVLNAHLKKKKRGEKRGAPSREAR